MTSTQMEDAGPDVCLLGPERSPGPRHLVLSSPRLSFRFRRVIYPQSTEARKQSVENSRNRRGVSRSAGSFREAPPGLLPSRAVLASCPSPPEQPARFSGPRWRRHGAAHARSQCPRRSPPSTPRRALSPHLGTPRRVSAAQEDVPRDRDRGHGTLSQCCYNCSI